MAVQSVESEAEGYAFEPQSATVIVEGEEEGGRLSGAHSEEGVS